MRRYGSFFKINPSGSFVRTYVVVRRKGKRVPKAGNGEIFRWQKPAPQTSTSILVEVGAKPPV